LTPNSNKRIFVRLKTSRFVRGKLPQGARSTSNENAGIPQWSVGCRNHRIPRIPQILPESRRVIFVKAGLYPNYLISPKPKTWYHKLWLNVEFSYCGIREGSVGFLRFGDSDIPQTTVEFLHFRLKSIGPPVPTPPACQQPLSFFQVQPPPHGCKQKTSSAYPISRQNWRFSN